MNKIIISVFLVICTANLSAEVVTGIVANEDYSPSAGTVVYDLTGRRLQVFNNTIMNAQAITRAITGFDGNFTFENLNPGKKFFLTRDMENCCTFTEADIESGSTVALTNQKAARIKGTLLAGDNPIPNTEVTATFVSANPGFHYYHKSKTDSKGCFVFKDLMPGDYSISVTEDVPQVGCCFNSVITKKMKTTVKPGQKYTVKMGGTDLPYITGKVTNTKDAPLHGVWVSLFTGSEKDQQQQSKVWSAVTDRKGNYSIYDIPPGKYSVQCFRRLAKNNASRVLKDKREITIPDVKGTRPKNTLDISIDKSEFMPLQFGQKAPQVQSEIGSGTSFDLSAQHGKVVVIHFYASWCKPCLSTMGDFDKLQTAFGDKIVVLAISLDESIEEFNKFISDNPPKHPHLFDGPWKQSKTAKDYKVVNLPTSIVIGPEGNIEQMDLFGPTLTKFVKSLLNKQKP